MLQLMKPYCSRFFRCQFWNSRYSHAICRNPGTI